MKVDPEILASASFPLPFRVVFLAGLGILAWATNLHGLYNCNLDPASALHLRSERRSASPLPAHRPRPGAPPYANIYSLCAVYFLWSFVTWSLYSLATHSNPMTADAFKYVAAVSLLVIAGAITCPLDVLFKRERDQFLRACKRCLFPAASGSVYFSDVVLADIFTSFAKVLGDLWLSFCMLLPGNSILTPLHHDSGWKQWILPTIMSLPYLVRLRQCVNEYSSPSNESFRPLFNALKYATSFPVIYLSAAQRVVLLELAKEKGVDALRSSWHGEHLLFRLWFLTAVINSLYSFWWDVTYDWGLNMLKPKGLEASIPPASRSNQSPPLSRRSSLDTAESSEDYDASAREIRKDKHQDLRPTLLYPVYIYPLFVVINFVLRMTWSIKLSSHLHLKSDGSFAIFYVEVAEIVRRWLWVFIRVEWEMIKKTHEGSSKLTPNANTMDMTS